MDYIKFNGGHNGGGGAFNCSQRFFIRVAEYLFIPLSNRIIAKTNLAPPRPLSRYPQCSSKILLACDFDSLCVRFPPRGAGRGRGEQKREEGGEEDGRLLHGSVEAATASSIVVSMFSDDCFDTVHRENVGSVSSLPPSLPLLLLADSNPSFLPSFLSSFPPSAFVETGRNMDGGRGRGTVILEGARGSYRNAKISPFVQVISIEWQTSNPERHLLSPLMDTKTFSSLVSKCFFFFYLYNYEL